MYELGTLTGNVALSFLRPALVPVRAVCWTILQRPLRRARQHLRLGGVHRRLFPVYRTIDAHTSRRPFLMNRTLPWA